MSMNVEHLESLLIKLQQLQLRLNETSTPRDAELPQGDPLVQLAMDCDFFLPTQLNVETLSSTVDNKIENVNLLLDRARQNADVPADAKAVIENEYLLVDADSQDVAETDKEMVKAIETR